MIKLSIIIVNWNTKELLMQCIKSLVSSINPPAGGQVLSMEIIVVDNGSTDGSIEILKKYLIHPPNRRTKYIIHLIENQSNLGFAKANNIGIKKARGEYIMLLNSDTIVKEGAVEKLIEFLDKNPNTAVAPLLILPDNRPQNDYYMKFPNLWQIFLYHNPLRPLVMKIPFVSSLIAQKTMLNEFIVDQLPGAALAADRKVWDDVGLLDEDYHFLFEDVDWCWRAKNKGMKLVVVSRAEIVHLGGASWKEKLQKDKNSFYYQFFASMLLFVRKNYTQKDQCLFKWAIIVNFILTLKLKLALNFLKQNGRQMDFLQ